MPDHDASSLIPPSALRRSHAGAPTLRGRGASYNPANRFDRIELVPDPEADPEDQPAPRTVFLRDTTSSIIARNESPDVGFGASVNPYRGCETGCPYCARGDTPILTADGSTRQLEELRVGDEIYGTIRRGRLRRYVKTVVLAHWEVEKPAYRIILDDGAELVASGDHRFLTCRGWKHVTGTEQGTYRRPHLTRNDKLLGIGAFAQTRGETECYKLGYLCGVARGDAHLGRCEYRMSNGRMARKHSFRLAMADEEALLRTARYLSEFGIETHRRLFQAATATRREIQAIGRSDRLSFERISELVRWPSRSDPEWARGFLAGIFDAEGSWNDGALRIHNTDRDIIEEVCRSLRWGAFRFVLENRGQDRVRPLTVVRLLGGLREQLRFFHTTDPAIRRKKHIDGVAVSNSPPLRVLSIEPLGRMTLFDITTGTGDFIANGVVSHNCYARPTHEYLGFSAGLDFETKILVKEDAPELLRRELSSPKWVPQTVALSGVTDCYQPIESRLRLTRACLDVLAEFRNPVMVITKHHRVTRDADVLADLATSDAAAAFLSVTTLDHALARVMEPRAATPLRRLEAIRALAAAGVPAGVMVAPVVPGLTDHELPSILSAAAEAGARFAGFTILRLPYGVKELFEDWLARHLPERRDKVLNRIRAIRGGRLNDPRFGSRMRGEGVFAEQIAALFAVACGRAGLGSGGPALSTASFRRPVRTVAGPPIGIFE